MTRTVIITGGAGGMGLATAKILGRDHRVVITDVNRERLDAAVAELRDLDIDATGVVGDITDRASVDGLFAEAEAGGHVRAVVHTAGVSPRMGSAEFIIRVNAVGTVNITEAYQGIAREGDALVNVASIAGHMTSRFVLPIHTFKIALTDQGKFERRFVATTRMFPERLRPGAAYTMSKAFVIWYSQRMAAVFGAHGARVLSVSPGSFDTAMGRLEENSGAGKLVDFAALQRFGRPEEVAEVLAFVAGEKPGYLTGTDILVDGGTKAGLDWRGMITMMRGA
ncbi:MAG TPA: SDR family oxidoreductase [Pseudonocardiaceae bacterium]